MVAPRKITKMDQKSNTHSDTAKGLGSKSITTDSNFPLHRCMRIVPHDQNSGAFFIAVLHKVAPLNDRQIVDMAKLQHSLATDRSMQLHKELDPEIGPSAKILMHQQNTEVADDAELPENGPAESGDIINKSQNQSRWKGVDPVLFFEDEAVIESLVSFFGIREPFPLRGHLVTRSIKANTTRRIYYISKSVQEILQLNLEVGEQLKIASLGLRMFVIAPMRKTFFTESFIQHFYTLIIFLFFRKRVDRKMTVLVHIDCLMRDCRCCFQC